MSQPLARCPINKMAVSARKDSEVANEGWYSENHWGFSEGTMEKQVASYDGKYGFLKKT